MKNPLVYILAVGMALIAGTARAQDPTVQLDTRGTSGSITANGGAVTLSNAGSMASLLIQTTGTFNLTWELQCAADTAGTAFDADDEIPVTLVASSPSAADSVSTNVEGLYTANIAGCTAVRVIATTFSSGTMNVVLSAISSGGGSGGGGGASGAVSITQGGNTAAVNASSQLSVNCANCTGTGASDIEGSTFTLGTDSIAPMGAYADETTPTSATEDRMSTPRLTLLRGLHVNPRDAAGAQLFGTAAAGADAVANPTLGGALAFNFGYNGTTWDRLRTVNTGVLQAAPTFAGTVASTGTGASGAQTQRVVTATDSTIGTVTSVTNVATIGTSVTPGTSAAHLGKAIDSVVGATDTGVAALMQRVDSPTTLTPASNDYAVPRLDSLGRQWVNCGSGCSGSGVTDNAAFTAGSGTINAIGAFFDDTGSATATENSAAILRMTTNKALHVNLRNASGTELTPSQDSTHDSAILTTGPATMGEATSALTSDTAVADGDATRLKADLLGRQITVVGCGRQDRVRGQATITDGSSTSVLAALGSGQIAEIYEIEIVNTSAVDVSVDIRDGTAGSVLWTLMAPATTDTGGGNNRTFTVPLTFTANTAVAADPSASATSIIVSVMGCKVL